MDDSFDNINTTDYKSTNSSRGITAMAYSPDGRFIAGVQGSRIIIWERNSGKKFRSFNSHSNLISIDYSPDGTEIVVGDSEGRGAVYSKGGKLLRNLN
jgi:WD40 repeat protein